MSARLATALARAPVTMGPRKKRCPSSRRFDEGGLQATRPRHTVAAPCSTMASRDRSASLPALFIARQQRVEPQIDPELGRAPAEGRRKSRRPSMLDALVPKASIPAAAPGPESPEHAWEALCQKAKQLAKPDLDATPPLSIEDIRRAALTEWVAEVGNAIISGRNGRPLRNRPRGSPRNGRGAYLAWFRRSYCPRKCGREPCLLGVC